MTTRRRPVLALRIASAIAAGLFSRSAAATTVLPSFFRQYAGDTLWALLVFLLLGFLWPRASTRVLAGAALGIAFAVEASQLYQAEWIRHLRATRLGALVLGAGWVTSDLLCYTIGVGIGGTSEWLARRRRA